MVLKPCVKAGSRERERERERQRERERDRERACVAARLISWTDSRAAFGLTLGVPWCQFVNGINVSWTFAEPHGQPVWAAR